jgi:hypothetical protein
MGCVGEIGGDSQTGSISSQVHFILPRRERKALRAAPCKAFWGRAKRKSRGFCNQLGKGLAESLGIFDSDSRMYESVMARRIRSHYEPVVK